MATKDECLKELSKTGKKVFNVMLNRPETRSNKYKLLYQYWVDVICNYNSFHIDLVNGKINIEAIFTAQRQVWKFFPEWKKSNKETEIKHEAYKEHRMYSPIQEEIL